MKNDLKWMMLSDVDGTLLRKEYPITEKAKENARRLMIHGVGLGIATGRSPISTADIAKLLDVNAPSILYGGAMIYDYKNKAVLWQAPMGSSAKQLIIDISETYPDVSILAYTDKGIWMFNPNDLVLDRGVRQEVKAALNDRRIAGDILKFTLCGPRESLEKVYKAFFLTGANKFSFASQHFAEVVGKNAGKGIAMKELSRLVKIPLDQFIVMGDGENDIEMFEKAGTCFAVGNAIKKLKNMAHHILPNCIDDGAAAGFDKAIELIRR
jgi:Cof subfamily protein (haloacid dehalogenase superfamily)